MNLRFITTLAVGLFLFGSLGTVTAQEAQERGQLWEVQFMDVPPAKSAHFEKTVKDIVALAQANKVDSQYGWHFWSDGFTYVVANTLPNFAALDDPDAWMNAFGEAGAEKLGAIFQQMEKDVPMQDVRREIVEEMGDWGYDAGNTTAPVAATMYTFRIKPGHHEQFGDMVGKWKTMWKEVNMPYNIMAYRTHMGDMDRVQFMFFHDGLANFMGEKSGEALAKKAGKTDMLQQLQADLAGHIDDMEIDHMMYRPEMSYDGTPSTASNR